jgi:hypothetical protein
MCRLHGAHLTPDVQFPSALTHVERQKQSSPSAPYRSIRRLRRWDAVRMILPFAARVATMHAAKAGFSMHCLISLQQMWRMQHVRRHVQTQLVQM